MQVKYTTAIFSMTVHKNLGDQQPTNVLIWSENEHIQWILNNMIVEILK